MADLDFFADLMITGTVLGLDHTSKLVDVEKVLGWDRTVEDAVRGDLQLRSGRVWLVGPT